MVRYEVKMILKKFVMISLLAVSTVSFAIDLSGTYLCRGFDSQDGAIPPQKITIVEDKKASVPEIDFGAYSFSSENYKGYLAVQGNSYGIYFQKLSPKDEDAAKNYGVGTASITFEQTKPNIYETVLTASYYQPEYKRSQNGGHGTAICRKSALK